MKRESPPCGFIFPEEFAQKSGLSTSTIIGLSNTNEIIRLLNQDFGLVTSNGAAEPNYGVNGVIPETELARLYLRCWVRGSESGLKPRIREKVCDFLCLPGNKSVLEELMNPHPTPNGEPEEPGDDEYTTWELSLLYGVGQDSWLRLMKKGVLRYRHLWIKPRYTRVAISGEVERLIKVSPESLPRPLQKQIQAKGRFRLQHSKDSILRLREQRKEPPPTFFIGRYREIPRSKLHLPLGEVCGKI